MIFCDAAIGKFIFKHLKYRRFAASSYAGKNFDELNVFIRLDFVQIIFSYYHILISYDLNCIKQI